MKEKLHKLSDSVIKNKENIIKGDIEIITKYSLDAFNLFSRIPNTFGSIFSTLRTPLVELLLLNNIPLLDEINRNLKNSFENFFDKEKTYQVAHFGMPIKKLIKILLDCLIELNDKFQSTVSSKDYEIKRLKKKLEKMESQETKIRIMYEDKIDDINKIMMKKLAESNKKITIIEMNNEKLKEVVSKFNNTTFGEKKMNFKDLIENLTESQNFIVNLKEKILNWLKNLK